MRRAVLLVTAMGAVLVLASGVAFAAITCPNGVIGYCSGTSGDDTMNGTADSDSMDGLGGNDTMSGYGDQDFLHGDLDSTIEGPPGDTPSGADTINGGDGNDVINGDGGPDTLKGNAGRDQMDGDYTFDDTMRGSDTVSGNGAADSLRGGSGRDELYGGPGNDTVNAVDGVRDLIINCGTGTEDRVFFDPEDKAVVNSNCEIRNPSEGEPPPGPG